MFNKLVKMIRDHDGFTLPEYERLVRRAGIVAKQQGRSIEDVMDSAVAAANA